MAEAMTIMVEGMSCEGCVRAVQNAIERSVPGTKIAIDLASGAVRLDAAPQERQKIEAAILDAGYEIAA